VKRTKEEYAALTAKVMEVRVALDSVIVGRETEPVYHAFIESLSRLLATADDPTHALGAAIMTLSCYMTRGGNITVIDVEQEDENARAPIGKPLN
jgi:hypothetical protein